jgi:CBS domain-containing protein
MVDGRDLRCSTRTKRSAIPDVIPAPADGVLALIGRTPMVRVHHLDTGPCELFLKLESANPGGSIKDRIGRSMIAAAESDGLLGGGRSHLVEATAGNTGLGLALVAAQRGYRLTLVIPDKMSREKILHLKALDCREQDRPKRVCTLVCDSGNKYLSKMFDDLWLLDQGMGDRPTVGDLTDLVTRRFADRSVVTVSPSDPLLVALNRMKSNDVSQLPVMEGQRIVGIVDESDLLLAGLEDPERLRSPVRDVMTTRLETVSPTTRLSALVPIFAAGLVPIVMVDERFVGLVTRIDVLGHLRRRVRA